MSDESLFREVDEEVRREQMEKLWKRYGNLAVAVAAGIIVGVAGYKGWQYYTLQQSQKAGAVFVQAMDTASTGSAEDVTAAFKSVAESSQGGFAMLGRLQVAGALVGEGKVDEAIKAYDAIAADSSVDDTMRDLARVKAAYLLVDSASSDDLRSRLGGLDVEGSHWRGSAREIIALAYYREARYQDADKLVSQIIADPQAPAGVRQRATLLASVLQPLVGSGAKE